MAEREGWPRREGWPCALGLILAVYLLTLSGSWLSTDLGEALLTARSLLDRGSLTLAGPDQELAEMPWLHREDGEPLRSRLAPLTPATLAPLLALDRWLGFEKPRPDGRLVHLQGILACGAALALLGIAVRGSGGSPRAAALAVAMTGFAWPVWRSSRRAGPEALLILLVALFAAGRSLEARGDERRGRALQWIAGLVLPWAHPTGVIVAIALALSVLLEAPRGFGGRLRKAAPLAAAGAAGTLSVMLIWNLGVHGDLLRGGYGAYDPAAGFAHVSPLRGAWRYTAALAPQVGLLVGLAAAAWAASRPRVPPAATAAPLVTLGLLALFSTFYQPEPARRLACAWPAWGALLGHTWDRIDRPRAAAGLTVLAAMLGLHFFLREEGRYFEGPGGLFYPAVLWVELLLDGRSPWLVGVPVALLAGAAGVAGRALAGLDGATRDAA